MVHVEMVPIDGITLISRTLVAVQPVITYYSSIHSSYNLKHFILPLCIASNGSAFSLLLIHTPSLQLHKGD